MQISWLGLSAFEITTKNPSGEVVIVTDPYDNQTGLRFPRTIEGQLVVMTHDDSDANNIASVTGHPYLIDMPGEFEVRGVFVFGVRVPTKTDPHHVVYRMEMEGMNLAHLGALDRALTDEELKQLGSIDILMIPVGGEGVLTPEQASEVISQVEPRVVIPMTHALPNLKKNYASVEVFCKELGACRREDMSKYKVSRKDLPEEDMLIVNLTR